MKIGKRKGLCKFLVHEGNIEWKERIGSDGNLNLQEDNLTLSISLDRIVNFV